jgi:predicted MFS family arabinose efflux permease
MTASTVRFYAAAIATAKVGTGIFFLINAWLMVELTGKPSSSALALIMTVLPGLLLSPAIGVIIDRGRPARLAAWAELFRGGVLCAYAVLFLAHAATGAIGYLVGFCFALGNEVQVLSWRAALARSAGADQLLRLNALTVAGGQAGQIVGAAASGFLLAALGPSPTIALTAAMHGVSAACGMVVTRRLERSGAGGGTPSRPAARGRTLADLRAGLAHIAERPEIAFFYLLVLANLTVVFGINGMLAPFVREELKLGAAAFGKIDAGYALGAIAGGLVIVRAARRFGHGPLLGAGLILAASSLLLFSRSWSLGPAWAAYVGLGLSLQTNVISLSLAQRATAPAFQGRVAAVFSALNGVAGLAVYAAVAVVAGRGLHRELYLAQAAAMFALLPVVAAMFRRGRVARLSRRTG